MTGARGLGAPWFQQFKPISMDWPRQGRPVEHRRLMTVRPSAWPMNLRTDTVENTLGDLGRRDRKGKGKGKRGIGWPKIAPEKLWSMDPSKRPIDAWGIIGGNLMGGEDEVLAVAKGYRTSFKNRAAEDRATIRGGIAVLHAIGRSRVHPDSLKSKIIQSKAEDAKLIKAVGGGAKTRKDAATIMRKRIAALGPRLARAAWGARGLYILGLLKGFNVARGVGAGVSAVFGPIGMAIAAAMSAHGAVISANAKNAAAKFQGWLKSGVAGGAASAGGDRPLPGGATSSGPDYKQGRSFLPAPSTDDDSPRGRRRRRRGGGKRGSGPEDNEPGGELDDDVPDPGTTSEPGKQALPVGIIVAVGLGAILLGAAFLGGGRRREQVVVERTPPREPARGARRDEREDERSRAA